MHGEAEGKKRSDFNRRSALLQTRLNYAVGSHSQLQAFDVPYAVHAPAAFTLNSKSVIRKLSQVCGKTL